MDLKKELKLALYGIIGGMLVLVIIFLLIVGFNKDKRNYELNIPQQEKLSKIVIKDNTHNVEVTDNEEIKEIINLLNGNKRTTQKESIQDYPVNSENVIQVEFTLEESILVTLFVYIKNSNYYLEQPYNGIYKISSVEYNSIEKYLRDNNTSSYVPNGVDIADENDIETPSNTQKFNRSAENVTVQVLQDTITREKVEILITDNNEDQYGWGVEFRVQEKVNGEWKDLKYVSDNLVWIDIAYELNKDNQLTEKLDIKRYYGELSNGIYRIVKPVYDNEYIDIYSDEFEIK